jgi:hypothetical protein
LLYIAGASSDTLLSEERKKMSFWKVLGGAAAGVGAIACLPVAGAVGAVTLAGAAVGAAVGGVAGAAMAAEEEEKNKTIRDLTAKMAAMEAKFQEQYNAQAIELKEWKEFEDLLIALFAMGMATAYADLMIVKKEEEAIEVFVAGMAKEKLSQATKDKMEQLRQSPPKLNTAIELAKKIPGVKWELFETVIQLVAQADDSTGDEEIAFLQAFRRQVA